MSIASDDLIRLLYAGVTHDGAFAQALGALAERFACRSAALVYFDPHLPVSDIQLFHGTFDAVAAARYRARYAALDPAPAAMGRLRIGQAAATDRLFSQEERANSQFLNEFYHPLGLREALGGPVANDNGRIGILAIHRGPQRGSFQDAETAEFGSLLAHAAQALQLRRAFFRVSALTEALDRAVQPLSAGLMVFTADGALTVANDRARRVLRREDGLYLTRSGRLKARHPAADTRLRSCFAPESLATKPQVIRVPRSDGKRPYILRAVPPGCQAGPFEKAGHFVLFVADPDERRCNADEEIRAALGLTPAAAALLGSLLSGGNLKGFAQSAGIAVSTAKFHLQSAFAATGTSRQVDLVRLGSAVLKDLALEGLEPGA